MGILKNMDLTGQILVSMPSLEDPRFYKTVIYLCAHSSEGSMGIIINKKMLDFEITIDNVDIDDQSLTFDIEIILKSLFRV